MWHRLYISLLALTQKTTQPGQNNWNHSTRKLTKSSPFTKNRILLTVVFNVLKTNISSHYELEGKTLILLLKWLFGFGNWKTFSQFFFLVPRLLFKGHLSSLMPWVTWYFFANCPTSQDLILGFHPVYFNFLQGCHPRVCFWYLSQLTNTSKYPGNQQFSPAD